MDFSKLEINDIFRLDSYLTLGRAVWKKVGNETAVCVESGGGFSKGSKIDLRPIAKVIKL